MSGLPITPEPPKTEQKAYSSSGAWRDVLLGVLILAAIAGAYVFGRHRRAGHLVAFAQCLSTKQAKMYGAYWCPHCAEQKEVFGSSFQYVTYFECGVKGSRAESPECTQMGIKRFPTWQFSDGQRNEGLLQLKALSAKTGCALP